VRDRPLSAEEARLWARLVATVEPLEGLKGPPTHLSAPAQAGALLHTDRKPEAARRPAPEHKRATTPPPPSNTLDGSWDRRLSRGLVAPELAVDLHGHTLDTAYRTLDAGLEAAIARGIRVLLLITGKPRDRASGRGAIRAAVGDWLAASRHAADIAAVRGAHPRHGGTGALYIILKRNRGKGC
jgi:DNA-nicking Smr family endonuclease